MSDIGSVKGSDSDRHNRGPQHILIVSDRAGQRQILLNRETFSIGRAPGNDIVLEHPSVSRQHATLLRVPAAGIRRFIFRILDGTPAGQRSKGGIRVNGKPVLACELRGGDRIGFGTEAEARYEVAFDLAKLKARVIPQEPTKLPVADPADAMAREEFSPEDIGAEIARLQETLPAADLEASDRAALIREFSFAELAPIPIVEIDLAGTVTYANPAALGCFSGLVAEGPKHPFLRGILHPGQVLQEQSSFTQKVSFAGKSYGQSVYYFPERNSIRIFATEILLADGGETHLKENGDREVFSNTIEGVYQTTADGNIVTANSAFARIFGYDSFEQLSAEINNISRQIYVDPTRRQDYIEHLQAYGSIENFRSQALRRDGRKIWISENARVSQESPESKLVYEGSVVEITERIEFEAELSKRNQLLLSVARIANLLLLDSDASAALPQALSVFGQSLGVDRVCVYQNCPTAMTEAVGLELLYAWDARDREIASFKSSLQSFTYADFGDPKWYQKLAAGDAIDISVRDLPWPRRNFFLQRGIQSLAIVPIFVEHEFWGLLGLFDCGFERHWSEYPISASFTVAASISGAIQRERQGELIREKALRDALTGLPSRALFEEQLSRLLPNAERSQEMVAVLFLDLDDFKLINDSFGHTVGDLLLQEVARRLLAQLRAGDVVSRWGGDEFTILLQGVRNHSEINEVVNRILGSFNYPFLETKKESYVNASIGVAVFPQDGRDVETLIKHADSALYQAKDNGKSSFRFYKARSQPQTSAAIQLSRDLRCSIENDELCLYYQPIVNLPNRQIVAVEALLRWNHPQAGLMSPSSFLGTAQKTGLIVPIGEWVLRTVLSQLAAWQDAGLTSPNVSLNLAARQLTHGNFRQLLGRSINTFGIEPERINLEITEAAAFKEVSEVEDIFSSLQALGVRLSIDDFGVGYSSFSRLQKLPIHTLKTDRSLIQNIAENDRDRNIIEAILNLGKNLGLQVIVEGVESRGQLEVLHALNCEMIQGYVFYKPMPGDEMTCLLESHS